MPGHTAGIAYGSTLHRRRDQAPVRCAADLIPTRHSEAIQVSPAQVSPAIIDAEPAPLTLDLAKTALVIIDMQRDFLEPGGFGAALGNDVSRLQAAVAPCRAVLEAARHHG